MPRSAAPDIELTSADQAIARLLLSDVDSLVKVMTDRVEVELDPVEGGGLTVREQGGYVREGTVETVF